MHLWFFLHYRKVQILGFVDLREKQGFLIRLGDKLSFLLVCW